MVYIYTYKPPAWERIATHKPPAGHLEAWGEGLRRYQAMLAEAGEGVDSQEQAEWWGAWWVGRGVN